MADQEKEFPEKVRKLLPADFEESVNAMQSNEIRQRILSCDETIHKNQEEMESDEKLAVLKKDVSLIVSGYREVDKVENAKKRFLIYTLQGRGEQVSK